MGARTVKLSPEQAREWKSAETLRRDFGTTRNTIVRMAATGKIRCRVIPTEVTLFSASDLERELSRQRDTLEVKPKAEVIRPKAK